MTLQDLYRQHPAVGLFQLFKCAIVGEVAGVEENIAGGDVRRAIVVMRVRYADYFDRSAVKDDRGHVWIVDQIERISTDGSSFV
jgi:hypothetical protein